MDRTMAPNLLRRILVGFHIDVGLLAGLITLAGVGLVILYSASGQDMELIAKQGVRLAIGFVVLIAMAQIPPHYLRMLSPWVYIIGVVLLIAVLFLGDVGKGAQRWLDLGVVRFQPSEILKLGVPMMIAWFLAERALPPSVWRQLGAGLLLLVPMALIAKQPDLGTAILVGAAGFFVLYIAGIRWRVLLGLGLLTIASLPILWHFLHAYQRRRVLTFLNPESDPLGAGYHIIQSKIAIGSGGLYGKGWLNGTQSHLEFLPERSTDFIFAVLGEEFGLIGIMVVITLYLLILARGLHICMRAQDTYSRLLAGSLTLTFFIYIAVNTGMVIGLLPVVGVPLPLISYGGTSLVTMMAAFGILMSLQTHRRLLAP